jgi:hypothetical protein
VSSLLWEVSDDSTAAVASATKSRWARTCLVNRGRAMNPMTKATIQKPGPTAAANPRAIPTAGKLRLTFPVRLWHHRSPPCGGFRP